VVADLALTLKAQAFSIRVRVRVERMGSVGKEANSTGETVERFRG
jgi:fructose-specific phosphotransferase system component IIB